MKRKYCRPALLAALSLTLCACHSTAPEQLPSDPTVPSNAAEPSYRIELETTLPQQELLTELIPDKCGAVRISARGIVNSIRYITDASQLPDNQALKQYDDAYFQDHALVLIVETVGSGSTRVGIASIEIEDSAATVTLFHRLPGDVATDDIAAWLLWAEVDAGLSCNWVVANHAMKPSVELN